VLPIHKQGDVEPSSAGSVPTEFASPAAVSVREAEDAWISRVWPLEQLISPVDLLFVSQAAVPALSDSFFSFFSSRKMRVQALLP